MKYEKVPLYDTLTIDGLYSVHYFEYMKNFKFSGEKHNFWELVYADKKSLTVTADKNSFVLEAGHLFLHKPNEFHNIKCAGGAANSVIFSFDCDCERLYDIAGRDIICTPEIRRLLANTIAQAEAVFKTPLGDLRVKRLEKAQSAPFASEQLLKIFVEQILILLIRGTDKKSLPGKYENSKLLSEICQFLEQNVTESLRFEDILKAFNVSASVVKKIFKSNMNCGVMEYFSRLKIEKAKQMIRDEAYNFTEIADALSFNTSQYFTTVFRRITKMTPTEYEASVKSKFSLGE